LYILSPTQEELNEWFCCKKKVAEFLVNECKMPLIHKNENKYYFAITKKLNEALDKVPLWMKFLELL